MIGSAGLEEAPGMNSQGADKSSGPLEGLCTLVGQRGDTGLEESIVPCMGSSKHQMHRCPPGMLKAQVCILQGPGTRFPRAAIGVTVGTWGGEEKRVGRQLTILGVLHTLTFQVKLGLLHKYDTSRSLVQNNHALTQV